MKDSQVTRTVTDELWPNWIGNMLPSYLVFRVSPLGERWVEGYVLIDREWLYRGYGKLE